MPCRAWEVSFLFLASFIEEIFRGNAFRCVSHDAFDRLGEILRLHEGLVVFILPPYLYCVAHPDEFDRLFDKSHLQVFPGNEDAPIPVEREHFHVRHELPVDELVLPVPSVEFPPHDIHLLVPHRLGIEYQAWLENIFAQDKTLLARCLQHLAEGGRKKCPSLRVNLGLYIS